MCRNIDQIKEVDDDISGSKSHTISPSRVMKENYHPMKILLGHIRMEHKVDKNFNLLRQEFGQIWALPGPFAIAKNTYVVSNIVFLFRFCFCEGGHLKEYPYQLVPGDSFIIQVIFPSAILSPTCFISFNLILCLFVTLNDLYIIVTAEHRAKIYFQKCRLGKCKNWEEKTYLTTKWFGL